MHLSGVVCSRVCALRQKRTNATWTEFSQAYTAEKAKLEKQVSDDQQAMFPGNFFNQPTFPRARGAMIMMEPGARMRLSAVNTSGQPINFGVADGEFSAFSPERLFGITFRRCDSH